MKKGGIRRIIYLIVLVGLLIVTKYFNPNHQNVNTVEAFREMPVAYTQHAKCRMECRTISEEEIADAIKKGAINLKKSDPQDEPCPTIAVENPTEDGQRIRVILATCENQLKVVTAIDLNGEYECDCR